MLVACVEVWCGASGTQVRGNLAMLMKIYLINAMSVRFGVIAVE